MTIYEMITQDIKTYYKAGKKVECNVLKLLKNDIDLRKTSSAPSKPFSTADEDVKLDIFSYIKNIKEQIVVFEQRGNTGEVEKLSLEVEALEKYVPKALTEEQIKEEIELFFSDKESTNENCNMFRKYINGKHPKLVDNKIVGKMLQLKMG